MRTQRGPRALLLGACLSIGLLTVAALTTAAAETSFDGKQITMLIGYKPGGGTDAVARLVGDYLVTYLPGHPSVIYRNMPGGGGTTAMNYFARQVEPDGLTIAVGSSTQAAPARWKAKTSRYNPTKFRYIGGVERGSKVLVINTRAEKRLHDKSKDPVVMGVLDGNRSGMQMMLWGIEYLGWNGKWVTGYPGTSELTLALQRGEIDVTSTANSFRIGELIKSNEFDVLVQSGTPSNGKLVPRPEFKDVPILPNLVRPKLGTEREKDAFSYWQGINALDKYFILPEGSPDDMLAAYRKAFEKVSNDKKFLKQGKKMISADFDTISPKDQEQLVEQVANVSDDALLYIDELKKKQGLPVTRR